ncbi:MAG: putative Fe-S cluster assembly protein SufT [Verrucomicrobiota bacterium]
MNTNKEIELTRDVDAVQIPSGESIHLPVGTKVMITQSLGGTYTVATQAGLARIAASNADALGLETSDEAAATKNAPEQLAADGDLEGAVWEQLKAVYDPEIPVNIVDLGLVYDCQIKENEAGDKEVTVKMTLTAPGCGMGPTIAADARNKIISLEDIEDAVVDLVWDPAWNQDMISEEGKMKLGMI